MKRLLRKVQVSSIRKKGEITVFLSLIFLLVLSLLGALIESASIRLARNYKRELLSLALESVFAEYDAKLLEKYHIFALDGTYKKEEFSYQNVMDRLEYYGAANMENKVVASSLLTDKMGKEFYRLAVQYEATRFGLETVLGKDELSFWEEQQEQSAGHEAQKSSVVDEIAGKLQEAGETMPEEGNPVTIIKGWKQSSFLQLVLGETSEVSTRSIDRENLPSGRELRQGMGEMDGQDTVAKEAQKALFCQYLIEHFSCFTDEKKEAGFCYELEYLLEGKLTDGANLEQVLQKMTLLRFPINYVYLQTSQSKKAEAEAMAASLCTLLTVPEITELVKQALLLAWAYGESVMDVRMLANGKKVPTVKSDATWQVSLGELAMLGQKAVPEGEGQGLSYEEYMTILLLLEGKEQVSMRALDLVESQLGTPLDSYITGIRMESVYQMRRTVKHSFATTFSYR